MSTVPASRVFHFLFGLREQTQPLHLLHYLCLESCRVVNQPHAIHLHYRHEPYGPLWDRIRPHLSLHPIPSSPPDYDPRRYADSAEGRLIAALGLDYAHEADFLRLDVLLQHGGVYADMDTLFVRPYPESWYTQAFLIGEEAPTLRPGEPIRPSLCNAVMFSQPGARFASAWRSRMAQVFDGSWSRHSCDEAAALWGLLPDAVHVVPEECFYAFPCSRDGLRALLEEDHPLPEGAFSLHLWAHLWWARERTDFSPMHAGMFDLDRLRRVDCTYSRLARRFAAGL
jgi:hypothetical protein